MNNKKITKATLKSFIKKNKDKLFIQCRGSFDPMTDGMSFNNRNFVPAKETNENFNTTLGIKGVWLTGSTRNSFSAYKGNGFIGIEVSNCCAYFTVAIKE